MATRGPNGTAVITGACAAALQYSMAIISGINQIALGGRQLCLRNVKNATTLGTAMTTRGNDTMPVA